jgi:hypothetical protein
MRQGNQTASTRRCSRPSQLCSGAPARSASRPRAKNRTTREAYALIQRQRHATALGALLHRDEHVARAQRHLHDLIRELLSQAAESGAVRDDVAPDELATYCLYALAAASSLPSEAAVRRLVAVAMAGLRRPL